MLFTTDRKKIDRIPHLSEYEVWKSRLTPKQFQAIVEELNSRVDGSKVHTSSWMPGPDWSHTVFQPIYEQACGRDNQSAAMCFGLILWEVMMNRPETWYFCKDPESGIKGTRYFIPGP